MKLRDRRRVERRRRLVIAIGVSFALGALVDAALTWRLRQLDAGLGPTAAPRPEAAHDPEQPRGTVRPGERDEPIPQGTAGSVAHEEAVEILRDRGLALPVAGVTRDHLRDSFFDARGARAHEAIDIMAPRNTPIRAVEGGRIKKLFKSAAGGLTIYQFDPSARFCYYYAHLERYTPGLREGQAVRRGEIIGYVGTSGNAPAAVPHLHFAIFRLTPERQWWKGEPVNPYAVFGP